MDTNNLQQENTEQSSPLVNEQVSTSAPTVDPKMETKRILIYLGLTFVLTYVIEILVIRPLALQADPQTEATAQMLIASMMFIPAFCVLLTRLITKEGFGHALIQLPSLRNNLNYYLIAWFGPTVLTLIGGTIYFLIFPGNFDVSLTTLVQASKDAGNEISTSQLQQKILIQIATAALLGPLLNVITCFGEEWGWRGYLLPKMTGKFRIIPVLLINGVIWGLWHAPLTVLGHNYRTGYPGFPVTGILAMCVFCTVMGTIFSYVTIKTNSCIPAVFAHGSLNSISSVGMYFTFDGGNPFLGPVPTGIIGGIGFIVVAVVMALQLVKWDKNRRQH